VPSPRIIHLSPSPMWLAGAFTSGVRPGLCLQAEKAESMIQLTRLNNKPLMVNSDLIKFVEQSPDTLVTLITGEKIVVLEPAESVLARIIEFRRAVLQGLSLAWDASSAHSTVPETSDCSETEPER
jgi:flagellar protein FlbD